MAKMPDKELITESSQIIYDGFIHYNDVFHRITRRARTRFEKRDWQGHQQDIVERVDLYEKSVRRIVLELRRLLGARVKDHELWNSIRSYFGRRLEKVPDAGFIKTFFNSVTRRIFDTAGTDTRLEFVSVDLYADIELVYSLNLKRYPFWGSAEKIFAAILNDFSFRVPYAKSISSDIEQFVESNFSRNNEYLRFEFIDSFFYQSARAYLIGRIVTHNSVSPIVIAFKNTDRGIIIDAVLTSEVEVSIVFSYTRSYYFADPNSVVGAVHFIHSILPKKPIDELYTVLGRLRQGKTERHRIFTEHLKSTSDQFVHTDGDEGLVMIVFTLPSYDLVFKIIRDKFGYPKTITRGEVIEKYKLVSKHDRAGRLIDTQEFLNLKFPVKRFSKELLDELLQDASDTVEIIDDNLLFKHVYIERRVRPLNLYLNEVSREKAELAILDYGQAIKDLARTNIFPGDLLLKNFGVTRHRRILFYDYDEVSLITECNFRDIPQTNDDIDEMRSESWYFVGEHDMFPEEFIKFLSMDKELRSLFLVVHGELLTAEYWREIQAMHRSGKVSLVVPYDRPKLPHNS
ncbi:MAG: bifunctional isocitrate dehydrogenase kinase/phosphatase [Gammaproteobacteria bacterium]|nr:MAG: bifunctional isocitrate dehydrogenase kinase/phosphatase [Gammaproteobacteria bacterium]RKZ71288.1 MAG: bifunctional isocitrate dehydrogenase kinase/phosphatase [Gammaproteobacteria bacterium]